MQTPRGLTTGDVARHFGCGVHHVRRIFSRGLLPEPARVGAYRVVPLDQLDQVEAALRNVGYLKGELVATK